MNIENIVAKILENKNDLIEDSFCYLLFENNVFDFQKLDTLISTMDKYNDSLYNSKIGIASAQQKEVNDTLRWIVSSTYKALIYHYNKDDLYTIKQFIHGTEEDATNAIDELSNSVFSKFHSDSTDDNTQQSISSLINKYEWIGINSITFGDGKIVLLDVEFYANSNYYIAPIADSTIESYLKYNQDNLSPFDVFSKVAYNNYEVCVGDASGEGNGVIYVIDNHEKSLVWFAFFENSDPFNKVSVDDKGVIHAVSATNIIWRLPIENPLKVELIYPK